MREILFRGKRSYNGEWVYGNLIVDTYGGSHIVPNEFFVEDGHHLRYEDDTDKPVFFNSETLGQFTGIYDRNGVKIFESDIVRADNGHIGYVVFRDGSFVKRCSCHNRINTLYGDNETVIGNIYDNPELLEEKNKRDL